MLFRLQNKIHKKSYFVYTENTQSGNTDTLSSDLDSDTGRTEDQQLHNTAYNFVQPQQKQQQGKHQKTKAI